MTIEYVERVARGTDLAGAEKEQLLQHLRIIAEIRDRYMRWFRALVVSAAALGSAVVAGTVAALVPEVQIPPFLGFWLSLMAIAALFAVAVTGIVAKGLGEQLQDAKAHCLGFLGSL